MLHLRDVYVLVFKASLSDLQASARVLERTYAHLDNCSLQMAMSLGYSTGQASLLISVVGITNTVRLPSSCLHDNPRSPLHQVGRVCSGWVTDLPQFRCCIKLYLGQHWSEMEMLFKSVVA